MTLCAGRICGANQHCVNGSICECDPDYYDIIIGGQLQCKSCDEVNCSGHGQCVVSTDAGSNSLMCTCNPGYIGKQCDVKVSDNINFSVCERDSVTDITMPCNGHGQCVNHEHSGSYLCICDSGFTGRNCSEGMCTVSA